MESVGLIVFSLVIYFFYHLVNRAKFTVGFQKWLYDSKIWEWLKYALSCTFCFTFHLAAISWLFYMIPWYYPLAAPVINMMVDKILR